MLAFCVTVFVKVNNNILWDVLMHAEAVIIQLLFALVDL